MLFGNRSKFKLPFRYYHQLVIFVHANKIWQIHHYILFIQPISLFMMQRHLYFRLPQIQVPWPFFIPFWKYPLKITPFEQKIVPIPANSPSEISPSQLQISLPGGYLILHWPHIDPQQKSPSQTVPSEKVYFPHPLNCPSFVFPSYVSPFKKVRVDCPSILSSLNSHFKVKAGDLQTPSPCLLPLLNWPSYVSPFSKVYFPFPANLFLRKVPSSLTEVIDWGVVLFYLQEIVKIPSRLFSSAQFPSKCLRVSPF